MKLQQLVELYKQQLATIHDNRREIRSRIKQNQEEREKLNAIKTDIIKFLAKEQEKGKSVYRVCMDQFKVIDGRFHILLSLFDK